MDTIQQAFTIIQDINSVYAVMALLILCVTGYLIHKINHNSKAIKLEETEKEVRKLERDKQMNELRIEIEKVNDKAENHKQAHDVTDWRTQKTVEDINERLQRLEENMIERSKFERLQDKVHCIEITTEKTLTILQERLK